ncbi:MAG: hypothetical protein LBD42_05650 [Desulfovibrio sp.]|jgi:hypothetical protein|nr:hypothetical protein [Desulfovibrio sp.]
MSTQWENVKNLTPPPDLHGPALAAYEECRACLLESLEIMSELTARGFDVDTPDTPLPPEQQRRLAAIAARMDAVQPELDRLMRERTVPGGAGEGAKGAAASSARRRGRGISL